MNTTGVALEAFARSICSRSRAVIVVGASGAPACGDVVVIVDAPLRLALELCGRQRGAGGLLKPVVQPGLAQPGAIAGDERALGHGDAVVARGGIGHDLARVVGGREGSPNRPLERERL